MTLIKQIKIAQDRGYNISYRKRVDGSYIVKSINGVKFTGAKGNAEIRSIVGASLSAKKEAQLKTITPPKLQTLTPQLEKLIAKVQRKMRAKRKKDISAGIDRSKKGGYSLKIKKRSIRKNVQAFGEQSTIASLNKALKYIEGIAYEENVMALISRIERVKLQFQNVSTKVDEITNKIRLKIDTFKEEWIAPINEILYTIEQMKDLQVAKTGLNQIDKIIS